MQGLGNDFVVINAVVRPLALTTEQVRFIADRHFGVGCDQLLLVESSKMPDVDFNYRIFNADGSEVEQCGNGARCFARFVREQGLSDKAELVVQTQSGIIRLLQKDDGQVTVNMGLPQFEPLDVPFIVDRQADYYTLKVNDETLTVGVVSMGNPHVLIQVPQIEDAPLKRLGALLENHPRFPQRVNVGFMHIVDRQNIRLRVHERGAGETLACGTNACAAAVIAQLWGEVDHQVDVELLGGHLQIQWDGVGSPVMMTGPAVSVFAGHIVV